jgi:hypothetical protein
MKSLLKEITFSLSSIRTVNVINFHSGGYYGFVFRILARPPPPPHTHIKHKSPKINCHHCLEIHYRAVTTSWLSRLIMTRKTCRLLIMCPTELICFFFLFKPGICHICIGRDVSNKKKLFNFANTSRITDKAKANTPNQLATSQKQEP